MSELIGRQPKNEVYLDKKIPKQDLKIFVRAFMSYYNETPAISAVRKDSRNALFSRFEHSLLGSTTRHTDEPFVPEPLLNPANLPLAAEISETRSQSGMFVYDVLFDGKRASESEEFQALRLKLLGADTDMFYRFFLSVPELNDKRESLPEGYSVKSVVWDDRSTPEPDLISRLMVPITHLFNFGPLVLLEVFDKEAYRFDFLRKDRSNI